MPMPRSQSVVRRNKRSALRRTDAAGLNSRFSRAIRGTRPGGPMTTLSTEQQAMVALFQRHVEAELAGDLATTMATMTDDPHLNHVPSMAGGVGREGVHAF